MASKGIDFSTVRRRCSKVATRLFDDFDRKRRAILTDVAREFYPLGVAGLAKGAEDLSDECPYDEDHRLLTAMPLEALRKGACGFHGNLTPDDGERPWFRFVDRRSGVSGAEHLDRLTLAVARVMHEAQNALYKLYEHLLCFGFACMLMTRDERRVIRATTLRVGTYAMGVGADGEVCRVARKFSWTAEQIISRFGDAGCPESVRAAARQGDDRSRWTVVNLVEPNASGDMRAYDEVAKALGLDDSMVWRSVYWLEAAKDGDSQSGVLAVSGFTARPIIAPRLDWEPGDVYGRGRGIDALCVARGMQTFQYDILGVSGLRGKPPLVVSSEFKDDGFRAGRGGVNYARFGEQRGALAYPVFAQLPDTEDMRLCRQDAQAEIAELFFNSAFATIDALKNNVGVKTATEVDALVRENMEKLNPVLTNLDRELLDPLVETVTRYALAAGVPPLTPDDVQALGGAVDVEYVSKIHMAAKQSRISAMDQWLTRVAGAAQSFPQILDKVNADAVADEYAETLGVPAAMRAADEVVAATRKRRAEEAAAQARLVKETAAADALGKVARVGSVPTDADHLGGALLGGGAANQEGAVA